MNLLELFLILYFSISVVVIVALSVITLEDLVKGRPIYVKNTNHRLLNFIMVAGIILAAGFFWPVISFYLLFPGKSE